MKISISAIDKKVNHGVCGFEPAMKKVEKYIIKNYDKGFEIKLFREWLNSTDDKPFKSNKNTYYWSEVNGFKA